MYLIDSHAHIYLSEFTEEKEELFKRSKAAGVKKILMPAIDSSTHDIMLQTEKDNSECLAMMGLHPCSVKENYIKELEKVEEYLNTKKFVAVGEIGLDFYWDKTFTKEQYAAFHKQIEWALLYSLPIVIHSRNATEECIDVIKQYPALTGVFHCFSGNVDQAVQITETNFLLGIGGVVTFKNAGLDKVIEEIGIEKVILETDAPYLAPVPYRGKRNEPAYVKLVAEKIASILGISLEDVAELTTNNAINLFKLS